MWGLAVLCIAVAAGLGMPLNIGCVVCASLWLSVRALQVACKPLPELVTLLGLEIPIAPYLDLAAVGSDSVIICWESADERKISTTYSVRVNGVDVGEVSQNDTSMVIGDLRSNQKYVIRIIVKSSFSNFKTASEPIRIRTRTTMPNTDQYSAASATVPSVSSTIDDRRASVVADSISIRSFKTLEQALSFGSNTSVSSIRDASSSQPLTRRTASTRKVSPAIPSSPTDLHMPSLEGSTSLRDDSANMQRELTATLEEVNREVADLDKSLDEEEKISAADHDTLVRERDELRQTYKERTNKAGDMNKQINIISHHNSVAVNKKLTHQRLVEQKVRELQKQREDLVRWSQEIDDMRIVMQKCATDQKTLTDVFAAQRIDCQAKQSEAQDLNRHLEEDIKDKGARSKQLETSKTNSPGRPDMDKQLAVTEMEQDRAHAADYAYYADRCNTVLADLNSARALCNHAYTKLLSAREEHSQQIALIKAPLGAAAAIQRPVSRSTSAQQRRTPNSMSMSGLGPSSGLALPPSAPKLYSSNDSGSSNAWFTSDNALYNEPDDMTSGMLQQQQHTDVDHRIMSGSGPSLLPSTLLDTASEERQTNVHESHVTQRSAVTNNTRQGSGGSFLPGLGAFPSTNLLPGLGATQIQNSELCMPSPTSPASAEGCSPGTGPGSPDLRASQVARNTSPDVAVLDSDTRSVRSGRSVRNSSGPSGSRFSHILGLDKLHHKQRGAMVEDGLALGSLSKEQTQSTPWAVGGMGEGSPRSKRRNSNPSIIGADSTGQSVISRPPADGWGGASNLGIIPHRRPYQGNPGSDDFTPSILQSHLQQASMSRPGSSQSGDASFADSTTRSLWGSGDVTALQPRGSPLGKRWTRPHDSISEAWGARPTSRPPSGQHSSFMPETAKETAENSWAQPHQAPIGTKPAALVSERSHSPSLNPAAQDFRSLFEFAGDGKKVKSDKSWKRSAKSHEMPTATERDDKALLYATDDRPRPLDTTPDGQHRRSRDTTSTVDSVSTDQSPRNSLDKMPSQTLSDAQTPSSIAGSIGKESLMAKIGRKSSSGMFALPKFQRDKRASRTADESPVLTLRDSVSSDYEDVASPLRINVDVGDEDGDGKVRPKSGRGSARSWSAVFSSKMGKPKGRGKMQAAESEVAGENAKDAELGS